MTTLPPPYASIRRRRFDPFHAVLAAVTALLFAYLYLPIVVVMILSVNDSEVAAFPLHGVTFRWFLKVFNNPLIAEGLFNSLSVALVVIVITIPLSLMFAHVLSRETHSGRASALTILVTLPMQTPRIILAVLLLLLFSLLGIKTNLATVTFSHVVLTMPFATLIIAARLRGIERVLEEAAFDLGASRFQTWIHVLIPLLIPAVLAATMITFTISFDEMVVTYFTIGTQSTLPILIWNMLSQGYTPELNAVGALITVSTFVIIAAAQALQGQRSPI
jgi:spermidine/putrescine transport system permease protein